MPKYTDWPEMVRLHGDTPIYAQLMMDIWVFPHAIINKLRWDIATSRTRLARADD